MAIDVNRNSSGLITLPSEVSTQIWQDTQDASVIQSLVPQIQLPGGGLDIPIITGDPEAEWVSETDEKPVSRPSFGQKNIKGYTMATIVPFSNQFRRDYTALYGALVSKLPGVLARKFDQTALGFAPSPGTGFDTLADATEVELNGFASYLAALRAVDAADHADVSAWALSSAGEIDALGETDTAGRPLLISDVQSQGSIGSILARPVHRNNNVANDNVVGVAGDWNSALWGYVEDISIDISDQATLNDGGEMLNLWQRNMFAVRVEFEVGFAVRDPKRFVKLTQGVESP